MGTGYTRNDTANNIADGNIINAADLDGEFDAVEAAFNSSTGHTHDGTAAEGGAITVLGPSQEFVASATEVKPSTNAGLSLGTSLLQFNDLYIDGTANIDTLAGASVTADLNFTDNTKAVFGAGSDLQIYHSGSESVIHDSGTGNLDIRADSLSLLNAAGSEYYARFYTNGAANLYHNGSLKFNTTSTGIDVTGNATFADNGKAIFGAGSDLQIYHDGSNSYIDDAGTGELRIRGHDKVKLQKYTGENFLVATADGSVTLNYDNAEKLATTSTGIDVTGTVTADGVDVSSAAGGVNYKANSRAFFGSLYSTHYAMLGSAAKSDETANSRMVATETSTGNGLPSAIQLGAGNIDFHTLASSTAGAAFDNKRMRIDKSGDISFYEDTGTTAKFFWDASAERLDLLTNANTAGLRIQSTGVSVRAQNEWINDYATWSAGIAADTTGDFLVYTNDTTASARFYTSNAERMRIDSSGNLLVGGTDTFPHDNAATSGTAIGASGYLSIARSGGISGYFNRMTSDGDIVQFRKDGATVGSIGTSGGDVTLDGGSGHTGIRVGNSGIWPQYNGSLDNGLNVDLGYSSGRFRNLYLSGGVYLGGTGAANKLDDYEEGTWTATVQGVTTAGTATYGNRAATYTKVGNIVYVQCFINYSSFTGTGDMRVYGLPFLGESGSYETHPGSVHLQNISLPTGTVQVVARSQDGQTFIQLKVTKDNASEAIVQCDAAGQIEIGLTYRSA